MEICGKASANRYLAVVLMPLTLLAPWYLYKLIDRNRNNIHIYSPVNKSFDEAGLHGNYIQRIGGKYELTQERKYVETALDRRTCNVGEDKCRKALLMGAGYSGTAFFSKMFTEIGCNIGHECMDTYGVSDWRRSFEPIDTQIFFTHKFVQVRHPLKNVRSWRGTAWAFAISSWYNCSEPIYKPLKLTKHISPQEQARGPPIHFKDFTIIRNATLWNLLPGEVKMLDYWVVANIRSLSLANMWWKLENMDENLVNDLCTRISCPKCNATQIRQALESHAGYNKHRREDIMPAWDEICPKGNQSNPEVEEAIQTVCHHARALCSSLQYQNC